MRTERAARAEELETKRVASAKTRERKERIKGERLREEVLKYLDFKPEHEEEALAVAKCVVSWTMPVGAGTVGRSQSLSLAEIAERAVCAWLRHNITGYDQDLDKLRELGILDAESRDDAQREASREVNVWLAQRRRQAEE